MIFLEEALTNLLYLNYADNDGFSCVEENSSCQMDVGSWTHPFSGCNDAVRRSAMICFIPAECKAHGIDSFTW